MRNILTASLPLRIVGWVVSGLFVPFAWLLIESYNFRKVELIVAFLTDRRPAVVMGLFLTAAVYLFFLFLLRRVWLAALVSGLIYQIAALVNYIKVNLNGDPFVPMDFTMLGSMGELLSFVKVSLPWWGYAIPVFLALYVFLLWFWRTELPKGARGSFCRLAGCILIPTFLISFLDPGAVEKNFSKFGMTFMDTALQASNYRANGFLGGFYLSIATMNVAQPQGYDAESVRALLDGYSATDGATDPDIIVFLCESYWDVRKLKGTTFSTDPLYFYDELCTREDAYSGTLYTTALGGGTVRAEFDILTGLTTDYLPSGASPYLYAKSEVPSYVSAYRRGGYKTIAMHPYDKNFYGRRVAYPHVGFDEFYAQEEIIGQLGAENATFERGYLSDDSFVDAIIGQLEKNKAEPTFLFAISMENHQTYHPLEESAYELTAQSAVMEGELLKTVNTYAQGVYHSTRALEKLVSYIDGREKETILVFFGDHLPTLGANYAAYAASGLFDGSTWEHEGRKVMYGTPYVIYGNYDLRSDVIPKEGGELSSYYLLSAAAAMGDADRTAYMNWLLERQEEVPYYNVRLTMPDTEPVVYLKNAHRLLTYDRLVGERYSER